MTRKEGKQSTVIKGPRVTPPLTRPRKRGDEWRTLRLPSYAVMTPFGRGDEAESALLFPAPNTQGGHFPPMLRQLRHVGRIGTFIALTLLAGNNGYAAAQSSTPILVAPVGSIRTVNSDLDSSGNVRIACRSTEDQVKVTVYLTRL